MNIAIIGLGLIGSTLKRKAETRNWDIKFILKSDGVYKDDKKIDELQNYQNYCDNLDLVFLAIPTQDDGTIAYNYIKTFIEKNIPIVTCEKGALSNYFTELKPSLSKIGYSATVGGGTRLLKHVKKQEMHAIVNGTLNYVFDEIAKGISFEQAIEQAKKLGYAEPGANNPIEILNKEATEDVPMKAVILCNIAGFSPIRAKDIETQEINEQQLQQIIKENRRYIVSITKEKQEHIGGFTHQIEDYILSAGFRIPPKQLILSGVDNALLINDKFVTGPGAGPDPTTEAMLKDAEELITNQ